MHNSVGHSNIYMILMMNLKANYNIITASKWNFLKAEWYLHVPRCPSDALECIQFRMKPKEWTWAILVLTCSPKACHFWVCACYWRSSHVIPDCNGSDGVQQGGSTRNSEAVGWHFASGKCWVHHCWWGSSVL